ncbi:adhesion G protein-coupled receptor E3-like isoform X2 [Myxocyprinus asiaticus]|uniref:adhesion G protein-coupled receptor E3-like isoform X2 n=1 Tax=Myxocyprinus asiaticus TaxID=70543 RepID=UPI002223CC26|nr:adhesion G protein-coupled receptor E3-like isoform X2 [Myxocyprinus asiaticus]
MMNTILPLTTLQLIIITSDQVIQRSQGNYWYCSPLVNTSYCANSSMHVDCYRQNKSCKAFSCYDQSDGCTCSVGSYSISNSSYYEVPPDLCTCKRASQICSCLNDVKSDGSGELTLGDIVGIVDLIANNTAQMTPDMAESYLKKIDSVQGTLSQISSGNDKETLVFSGNTLLKAYDNLVSVLVVPTNIYTYANISLNNTEVRVLVVGPKVSVGQIPLIITENANMEMDLYEIANNNNNNGSAAVAFMSYTTMENVLRPDFFNTSDDTVKTMMSTVISATLPKTDNRALTKPVNFTLKHIRDFDSSSKLSCVYWNISEWIVDGCSVVKTNSSHTVCSCDHLSTFALIMQTSSPPEWSPGVNNVARINICLSLLLAHLLFLLTQQFLNYIHPNQVMCTVISGVLHFFFLSSFVWMLIEGVLLFICVKNLSQISSKQREVLSSGFMMVIGYVIAFVVVGVSAGLVPEGYGSEKCWIKIDERGLIWSFLGPVCTILALNMILFINIIVSLNSTLTKLNAAVSQMKQTKIMVFKTLAQFVVLGCPWILGFFIKGNRVLHILFLILNSQQGTFIFLIHCVLNDEVRQQYVKCFRALSPGIKHSTNKSVPKKH